MELSKINPHLRYARHHHAVPLIREYSYCYDCRLFYAVEGEGQLEIEGKLYPIAKHHAIYVPRGSRYRTLHKQKFHMMVFDLDPVSDYAHLQDSLQTATEENFDPLRVLPYPLPEELQQPFSRYAPRLYEPLQRCVDEFLMEDPYFRESASALMKYTLIELIRTPRESAPAGAVAAVAEYIRQNYGDPTLNNQQIAEKFNYHPYYLSTLMKQSYGKTLHEFLLDHRLKIAKDLLLTTELDVNTVAWKCGFNSTAYFIKQFKARIGSTPKQYRKNMNI